MSLPQDFPLTVYRGDSYSWRVEVWEDDAHTDPADLTGAVAVAAILQSGRPVVPLTCTVTGNQIDVVLTAAASAQLAVLASSWDVQVTYPSGDVKTLVAGAVRVRLDVTGAVSA